MTSPRVRLAGESALLGALVGVLVVLPWARGGWLLLLDWVSGPNQNVNAGVYGLSGGSLDAVPFRLFTAALRDVVGASVVAWLLVLAFFPIAAAGASVLAGGPRWRRHVAALLFICNPFVVDRVRAGHVAFLLGLALLPWLVASARHAREMHRWVAVRPAAWFAVSMAISPHAFWIGGVALVAVSLLPRPTWRDAVRTVQIGLSAGLVYAYGVALYVTGVRTIRVTDADLTAYAPVAGPGGLLATLLSLHGFWRDFGIQVRTQLPAALAVLALITLLALVVLGTARMWVVRDSTVVPLLTIGVVGLVLGSGVSGPFAGVYRAMFEHLPLFETMREQQKWLALTLLMYAVTVGWGVERLADEARARLSHQWVRPVAPLIATGLLLVSAPSLLLGLGGSITTSTYPTGWYDADVTMGNGDEQVLFLPWHGYQPFDFTDGRSVATPAAAFFRRPVLSSDAVEVGALHTDATSARTAYVDRLVAEGGGPAFARMLAPLGVRYVALAHGQEDAAYSWVASQPGLVRVVHTDSIDVYRVEPDGTGRVVSRRAVPDLTAAQALAGLGDLGNEAVTVGGQGDGPLPSDKEGGLHRLSPTSWAVDAGTAGWVVVPEEWSPGWRSGDASGTQTLAGTVAIRLGSGATTVDYAPWTWIRVSIIASVLALLGLFTLGLVEHRHELADLVVGRHERRSART